MRASFLILILLSGAMPLVGQTISETMEIRVTNVDVVVIDADGNPVPDLTKEDFTLLENGRKVEISNLYEERDGQSAGIEADAAEADDELEAPRPRKPRRLVVMFDESSLMPHDRDRTLDHVAAFLDAVIEDSDRAMIVAFNDGLTIRQPFTSDADQLHSAIESFRGSGSQGLLNANRFRQLQEQLAKQISAGESGGGGGGGGFSRASPVQPPTYAEAMGDVRVYAQEELNRNNRLMLAVESLVNSLGGLEGRKAVVLVTNSLSRTPGREAFEFLEAIKHKFIDGSSNSPSAEASRFSLQKELTRLTERASSLGVVVHILQGGGASSQLTGADVGAEGGFEVVQGRLDGLRSRELDHVQTVQELAGSTGGISLIGSSNIAGALGRVSTDMRSHYSLGYRSQGERDKPRRLEVRVNRPGVRVRHPHLLMDRSIEQEMKDRLATVLSFPETAIGHGLTVSAASPAQSGDRIQIPLTISIPTENLTLLPEGEELVGAFGVHSAFLNRAGSVSVVNVQQQSFRFPAESRARRKTITLQLMVDVDSTVERIAVAVVDGPSQLAQVVVKDIVADAAAGNSAAE